MSPVNAKASMKGRYSTGWALAGRERGILLDPDADHSRRVQELAREPTAEELAARLELPVDKVRRVLDFTKDAISLETPIGDDDAPLATTSWTRGRPTRPRRP